MAGRDRGVCRRAARLATRARRTGQRRDAEMCPRPTFFSWTESRDACLSEVGTIDQLARVSQAGWSDPGPQAKSYCLFFFAIAQRRAVGGRRLPMPYDAASKGCERSREMSGRKTDLDVMFTGILESMRDGFF